jgi:hypothetical protein
MQIFVIQTLNTNEETLKDDELWNYIMNKKYKIRRIWTYQRGNQNPYIEEQTTQWSTEKVQKDKKRSTKLKIE